jgi:hypothetical protein
MLCRPIAFVPIAMSLGAAAILALQVVSGLVAIGTVVVLDS